MTKKCDLRCVWPCESCDQAERAVKAVTARIGMCLIVSGLIMLAALLSGCAV